MEAIFYFLLQEFIQQFRVLLPKNLSDSKEDISLLLEKKVGLDPTMYQIGKTKVISQHARLVWLQFLVFSSILDCILFGFFRCF